MIKVFKHTKESFEKYGYVKGGLLTPAGCTKLVGAYVTSSTVMNNDFDESHEGFNLKLQIDNKSENPINNHFDGGRVLHPFKNLSEIRVLKLDCDLRKSQKLIYTLVTNSETIHSKNAEGETPSVVLKIYLIFE
ncbi:MAG: hypothetical protein PF448_06340 [Bacteroidales bacterium]|jgi:hypothetical protein|nr:hypothetical protein [Bacteroidales bacterium]